MKLKLTLDPGGYSRKPTSKQAADISINIAKYPVELTVEEFSEALLNGHSWSNLYSKPERKKRYWSGQQLFCVDLDDNPNLEFIINSICNDDSSPLNLNRCIFGKPLIVHESFSSTEEHRKLRVIYCSNQLVIDGILAYAILRYLKDFWDSLGENYTADPCTVDLARILYGTNSDKSLAYFPANTFSFDDIVSNPDFEKYIYDPRNNLGDETKKEIVNLPEKSDLSKKKHRNLVNIVWEDCRKNIIRAEPSGYQALWSSGRRLSQLGLVSSSWIHNKIMGLVSGLPEYQPENGYKHSPEKIIRNSIEWGSSYCYNYLDKE